MITNPTTLNACKLSKYRDDNIAILNRDGGWAQEVRDEYAAASEVFYKLSMECGRKPNENPDEFIRRYRDAAIAAEAAAREYLAKK